MVIQTKVHERYDELVKSVAAQTGVPEEKVSLVLTASFPSTKAYVERCAERCVERCIGEVAV